MEDGGTVFIAAPANPFRCPPGPYERASLIAHYLKTRKPKSKVIILDAKDAFSKQRLFQNAWKELYPDHLEWVSLSQGGKVNAVKADEMTLVTDFTNHKATVANVIPPQRAAPIAHKAGVADRSGWCPVDPVTFESKLIPNIHVIGDAAIMGGMPKSAFSANAQAKVCAAAVAALLRGEKPAEPRLINTCYSLVAPDYGITVAGVYKPTDGVLADIQGAGGVSPIDAPTPRTARWKPNSPKAGSRRSPARCSAEAACDFGRCAAARRRRRAGAGGLRPYTIAGDAIPASLTGAPGDAERGLKIVTNRQVGLCLLCHSGPYPQERFQGTMAPDLKGAGARSTEGQLRLRIVDAAKINPETIMPPYYRLDGLTRVAPAFRGKPILTAEQIEDVVAYLMTLKD